MSDHCPSCGGSPALNMQLIQKVEELEDLWERARNQLSAVVEQRDQAIAERNEARDQLDDWRSAHPDY